MRKDFWLAVVFVFLGRVLAGAQNSSPVEGKLPPELAWRVEVLFRSKVTLPPQAVVHVGPRSASEIDGYDRVSVSYSANDVTSQPVTLLLAHDGRTLMQLSKFDISADPQSSVKVGDRPVRGANAAAPVSIVVFDDLECPFCAQLNATMFPAVLDRYKDLVQVVYMDLPSPGHPWALRAATDTACLAKSSVPAYWNAVDAIHQHAEELGGKEHSLAVANESLDTIVTAAGRKEHVDEARTKACVAKQDRSVIDASRQRAETLHVEVTPTFFVNGARIEGAVSPEFLFHMIDAALIAKGKPLPQTGL
jgi:protein-disulfide isomerase